MIIGGPASQLLAGRVAAILGETLALCDYKTFPDGESYTQVVTPLVDEVVIIQSTPTDQDLVYLLQLLDVCGASRVSLVIPYFGYARQDKLFEPGETIAASAMLHAIGLLAEGHAAGDPERVRELMSGNLCRCGAYPGIERAVLRAAEELTR